MATIGKTIKSMREGLGLSQTQFAAKAGISFSTLGRIERDEHVADTTYGKCAAALGTTLIRLREEAMKADFTQQATLKGETKKWDKVWINRQPGE